MKISISYFYNIRFFKPYQIPLSTAKWDPAWYHNFTYDSDFVFKDKNGVYNGIRTDAFCIPEPYECKCGKDCQEEKGACAFLSDYYNHLKSLDFNDIIKRCERLGNYIKSLSNFEEEPELILIVYETPKNPCSERGPLQKWFAENGYNLREWSFT